MSFGSAGVLVDLSRGRRARRTSTALGGKRGELAAVGFPPVRLSLANDWSESVGHRRQPSSRSHRWIDCTETAGSRPFPHTRFDGVAYWTETGTRPVPHPLTQPPFTPRRQGAGRAHP